MRLRDNITKDDIKCNCGCGFDTLSPALLDILQRVREHFDRAIHINSRGHSACRCEKHNVEVGGVVTSKHLPEKHSKVGRAADIEIDGIEPSEVYKYLNEAYTECLGLGLYNSFVHVDVRMDRAHRWNNVK